MIRKSTLLDSLVEVLSDANELLIQLFIDARKGRRNVCLKINSKSYGLSSSSFCGSTRISTTIILGERSLKVDRTQQQVES